MQACCWSLSGAYDFRSQPGVACLAGSSGIEAMSKVGSRCTVLSPAAASALRCLVPLPFSANAR